LLRGCYHCVVILNHVPFTRILIPIAFLCENPIPDSRKIHDCIHSRYQVGSRLYLSLSWRFSRLTCSSELFHHVLSMLLVNKQGDLSLTNKSINYSSTDQSIKLAFYDWHCISKQCNQHEQLGRSQPISDVSTKRLTTRSNVNSIAHCFHRLHFENYDYISYIG
jgi:hypothetical protein